MICRVISDSMMPLIPVGTELRLEPVKQRQDLARFDIIVFIAEQGPTCHFVWNFNQGDDRLVTRSLKRPLYDDTPIEFRHILGRVRGLRLSFWRKLRLVALCWWRGRL